MSTIREQGKADMRRIDSLQIPGRSSQPHLKIMILVVSFVCLFSSHNAFATGDCNGVGGVSIDEVQSAINMFLGIKPVLPCVDENGNKIVSIDEVQKTINSFLGITPSGTTKDVSAGNNEFLPYDAKTGSITFAIHPTSVFTYNINGFEAGDRLVFDAGTKIEVVNSSDVLGQSGTDGIIDVNGVLNGKDVTIHLTEIAVASDGQIFSPNSFRTVFGADSLLPK